MSIAIKQNRSKPVLRLGKGDTPFNPGNDNFLQNFQAYVSIYNTVVVQSGSTSEINDDDIVILRDTDATYRNEGKIIVTGVNGQINFEAVNPEIATVNSEGIISYVSDGTAKFLVNVENYTKQVSFSTQQYGGATVDSYLGWQTGSLGKHCEDQIDLRLVDMVKSTNIPIFSSQNHSTDTFIRNTNCWLTREDVLAPVDLTAISPSNSRDNNRRAGTLITPRHVLNAAHYPLYNGDKIYFVTQDGNNTVIERTIVGTKNHPSYTPYHPDLRLYTLNADVPNTISFCKVLPANFRNYLINEQSGRPPTVGLDQEEKATVQDLYNLNSSVSHTTPTNAKRLEFYESKISGDSGNPSFLVINNELVLLTCWTYGGAGSGTSVQYYKDDINGMIVSADTAAGVSTGYTVTEIDLSSFNDYS